MCELFGLSFNKPVSSNISFRGFRKEAIIIEMGGDLLTIPIMLLK